MSKPPVAPAATFVIFGALGDLTRRLLMPAIVNLSRDGLLDEKMTILGIGHSDADSEDLRAALDDFVSDDAGWQRIRGHIEYLQGDFTQTATFNALAERLKGNAVFYLATAPNFFGPIIDGLADAGLLDEAEGFRRVVIEKPFGTDLASAKALNRRILARASEAQIYRIDHFLGKDTVQNIMVARFGNPLLEAVCNSRYVDHVQITAAETVTVGTRGKFYDTTGALRDMVPNHLFQLLALIGMEPPNSFDAEAIRTEKAKLIAAVRPIAPGAAVRGLYEGGRIGDETIAPYVETADVDPASSTETYVAMRLEVDTWRWAGVPFYLRTGKALAARDTEIVLQFRDMPLKLFHETAVDRMPPNRLVLQIQPDEGITLQFAAKVPGPRIEVAPVALDFRYADAFAMGKRTGYETLLYDVLVGEQMLFQRADQIEGGWRAVQPLLDAWPEDGPPEGYTAGSSGPASADALIARDGRQWHKLG